MPQGKSSIFFAAPSARVACCHPCEHTLSSLPMETYRGIRYGTAQRFGKPSLTPLGEDFIFDPSLHTSTQYCPQIPSRLDSVMGDLRHSDPSEVGEDCLRVSIFTPSREGSYPVLVWICGGAFVTGSGEYPCYGGERLSEEGGIVVVNISYRVGVFGFLYQPEKDSVNLGIQDMVCALRWIKDHIASFGGDPSRITVCGQSAGAYAIGNIIAMNTALFSKAIMMSGPYTMGASGRKGRRIRDEWFSFLEKDTPIRMLIAQGDVMKKEGGALPICPVGMEMFPKRKNAPYKALTEVLLTSQRDDSAPYVKKRALWGISTMAAFTLPMYLYSWALRRCGVRTRTRILSWRHSEGRFGASHTMEVPLLFGTYDRWKDAPMLSGVTQEEFERESKSFREYIVSFVKGGLTSLQQ